MLHTHTHTHTGLHTYLAVPSGLCPSSPTKGQTWAPEVKVPSPDYWTTREFPSPSMKCYGLKKKKKKIGCWSSSHCILSGRRKMRKRGALSSPAGPEDYLDFPHNFPFYLIHPRWKRRWRTYFFLIWWTCCLGLSRVLFKRKIEGNQYWVDIFYQLSILLKIRKFYIEIWISV